MLKLLSEIN
jgi:hypothetical protein